jgi:hypothetical protein
MNIDEAISIQRKLFERRMELREKKGHDYANLENVHLNFDTLASICRLLDVDVKTPQGCAFFDKLMKVQREANLLFSGKTPSNEALIDTILDLANYNDLELEILIRDGIVEI